MPDAPTIVLSVNNDVTARRVTRKTGKRVYSSSSRGPRVKNRLADGIVHVQCTRCRAEFDIPALSWDGTQTHDAFSCFQKLFENVRNLQDEVESLRSDTDKRFDYMENPDY